MVTCKLSKTSQAEYSSCQRKFYLNRIKKADYDADYRPSNALAIGAAFAQCQELIAKNPSSFSENLVILVCGWHNVSINNAARVYACLKEYYKNVPEDELVKKCEEWIKHDDIIGKADKIIFQEHKIYILEEKTASDINKAALMTTLPTDTQICLYAHCAKQFDASGLIFRVVKKPAEERKKYELWSDYVERCTSEFLEIRFDFEELKIEETLKNFFACLEEIRAKETEEEFIRNERSCEQWNQGCQFYSRCHGINYTLSKGKW